MVVKKDISDKTHRILEEELDDYDPAEVEENVEEWLDRVPPATSPWSTRPRPTAALILRRG